MGVNNRQRRAAKQRKRAREQSRRPGGPWGYGDPGTAYFRTGPDDDWADPAAFAEHLVDLEVRRLSREAASAAAVTQRAQALLRAVAPLPASLIAGALTTQLRHILASAIGGGWSPLDLGEIVRRRLGAELRPLLAGLLAEDAARGPQVGALWRAELDSLGRPEQARLTDAAALGAGLRLAGLLAGLPVVQPVTPRTDDRPSGTAPPGATGSRAAGVAAAGLSEQDAARLAKVRGLLAKAESTEYDEEAEALSAKAQELISRYALEKLLEHDPADGAAGPLVTARRIWLDAPYLMAKASLVHAVAEANRCRSVVTESLGFCTVVGDPPELRAVDLLVTSLLVQANAAMLRHGQQVDGWGVSRTRSFRQSFLYAFAGRIGERLRAATAEAVSDAGGDGRLLPALRSQEVRVNEAFEEMFPDLVHKAVRLSNGQGWAAGRAAADLAQLDVHQKLTKPDAASA